MLKCDVCGAQLNMNSDGASASCTVCGMNYPIERLRAKLGGATAVSKAAASVSSAPNLGCDNKFFDIRDGYLVKYNGRAKEVVIPDGVVAIDKEAFKNNDTMESVVIPNSVTSIRDSAFCGCTSLTSVTIPNSVTSIGDDAFRSCYSLVSVTIPSRATLPSLHPQNNYCTL